MYTLLIADDEEQIRNGLMKYIRWEQIEFRCIGAVSGGREAIDAIVRQQPDVILCDIRMPAVSGLDVARYVSEHKLPIVVVLLSAYRDFEHARTAMAYGVHYYIVKSARHAELIETFARIREELDARGGTAEQDEQLIASVKQYVGQHLDTATLESVAAYLNRNPSNLSQYFKQHTGIMFSQYLTQERMRYASILLCDARSRVNDVSESVGYANAQNFTRAFRQHFGVTPSEYRQRHTGIGEIK